MEYAVIETGGKQYRVTPGLVLHIDKLSAGVDTAVMFDKVLLYADDTSVQIGTPFVSGIAVHGKVLDVVKGTKVRVSKFRAKSRHRRVQGFRHTYSKIEIQTIKEIRAKESKKEEVKPPRKSSPIAKNTE